MNTHLSGNLQLAKSLPTQQNNPSSPDRSLRRGAMVDRGFHFAGSMFRQLDPRKVARRTEYSPTREESLARPQTPRHRPQPDAPAFDGKPHRASTGLAAHQLQKKLASAGQETPGSDCVAVWTEVMNLDRIDLA